MYSERGLPSVEPPPLFPLEKDRLFPCELAGNAGVNGSVDGDIRVPDTTVLQRHFKAGGVLQEADAIWLIETASALFAQEPNVLRLEDPVTVCGDIHGQYYDLLTLLELGGDPGETQYLFLGDYVDRGIFSCEVTLLLFAFKIRYPRSFWILRGNHECRHLSCCFTFRDECLRKYGEAVYDAFQLAFDRLPLAALVAAAFFCVHGGISPYIKTIREIDDIERVREPPMFGPMCDLLWSDPMEEEEEQMCPDALFLHNALRGCSFLYSSSAVEEFLTMNGLLSVIRAHEAQNEGFRFFRKVGSTGFPSVICIFSAPNYCDAYDNRASILKIERKTLRVIQFMAAPHPYLLPNFMNAFTWSLPFLYERLVGIIRFITAGEEEEMS
ncbi:serine/threonine protein phosphatase, putative [Trypanosoma cruzi]|nr:serine/threonine protein phosphatase, putative [Trypanosoma cruzi]PBJ73112.1 serine/threonine protein phosphatase [Trypanosoma cruzi cruzi]